MAYIEIDLDDIDFDDLLDHLIDRIKTEKPYSPKENKLVEKLAKELSAYSPENLADQMKMEYLLEIKERYSEAQLREMEMSYRDHNCKPY